MPSNSVEELLLPTHGACGPSLALPVRWIGHRPWGLVQEKTQEPPSYSFFFDTLKKYVDGIQRIKSHKGHLASPDPEIF